ncbi:MAG: HAD family hydrolase [Dehalococcoidia bacterium]|nr:HAD family hydrolase [Dehalococcoidia bacterium]
MNKAVFLDRDGVVNRLIYHQESGIIDSPFVVSQFQLLPGVGEAISRLNTLGYKVIVVTNQPGIAKNHFSLDTLQRMHRLMQDELKASRAVLDGIYYCPHHPEGENPAYRMVCQCRKPAPGLLMRAAQDFHLNLAECYLVGDSLTDIQAGQRAGCRTVLLGKMKCEVCNLMDEQRVKPDAIAGSLAEAVTLILTRWEPARANEVPGPLPAQDSGASLGGSLCLRSKVGDQGVDLLA